MSATPLAAADEATANTDESVLAPLSNIAPFQDLPQPVHKILEESSDRRTYSAGQTVYSLGQYDGGEFFVVLKGKLKVSVLDAETGSMQIDEISENSIFGLEAVLTERPVEEFHRISVTADNDIDLIAIDAEAFRGLASSRPSLMRNIAMYFALQLSGLRFKTSTAQAAPEQRVFAALLKFVQRSAVNGDWRIDRMPKHRELADQAGVDEAIAASAVASLIQEGVAKREYPGLIVNDMQRLNQLAS